MDRMIKWNMGNSNQEEVAKIWEATIVCKLIILIQITKTEIINNYKEEQEAEDSEDVVPLKCFKTIIMASKTQTNLL